MRTGITFEVCVADRARLEAVVADRNSPQKHVWRAGIILATAAGAGTVEIMRRTGKSKPCVWRWQERFMAEGVDGLLRDKTRPSRIPPLEPGVALRIVDLTLTDPPAEATHWTAAMMAGKLGVSVSSVQRFGAPTGSTCASSSSPKTPTRRQAARRCRASTRPPMPSCSVEPDPGPRSHAGLPEGPRRNDADYKRHGTTTLFAALTFDGTVIGRNMSVRHQGFLNTVEAGTPAGVIHAFSTTTPTSTPRSLDRHPRWTFHFTPTSCSWLNAVEGFFARQAPDTPSLTFKPPSTASLHNASEAKPFRWTADPDTIISAVKRGHQALDSIH